jgi:hypothetical protein
MKFKMSFNGEKDETEYESGYDNVEETVEVINKFFKWVGGADIPETEAKLEGFFKKYPHAMLLTAEIKKEM